MHHPPPNTIRPFFLGCGPTPLQNELLRVEPVLKEAAQTAGNEFAVQTIHRNKMLYFSKNSNISHRAAVENIDRGVKHNGEPKSLILESSEASAVGRTILSCCCAKTKTHKTNKSLLTTCRQYQSAWVKTCCWPLHHHLTTRDCYQCLFVSKH